MPLFFLYVRRYSVGMAISAYQKGRMLLISADKAPATGCILFESVDSGRTWVNISDDVIDAAAALTGHAPEVLEQAPLAMFVPGESDFACFCHQAVRSSCHALCYRYVLLASPTASSSLCVHARTSAVPSAQHPLGIIVVLTNVVCCAVLCWLCRWSGDRLRLWPRLPRYCQPPWWLQQVEAGGDTPCCCHMHVQHRCQCGSCVDPALIVLHCC